MRLIERVARFDAESDDALRIDAELTANWLVAFLRDECIRKRKISKAIVGLSGGVDSAVTTYLCARAFGPENTYVFRMPYKVSSQDSLDHAKLVVDDLGVVDRVVEITEMVDGYLSPAEPEANAARIGNVCARCRMIVLFDQSYKLSALPIGTGNKTERLFGYYTWHADDAPPINPMGDLFKTQVYQLADFLGVPKQIVEKPPTADLIKGQTDEGDWGITIEKADRILVRLVDGWPPDKLVSMGFDASEVDLVRKKVGGTHWKRRLPTVAMLSDTAIGEYYLRPVDY
ncbi:MAG: NAD+ synthase [Armatimonadota bacterium]|nr:NAD+ synthase [Armatimonadota bacterium]